MPHNDALSFLPGVNFLAASNTRINCLVAQTHSPSSSYNIFSTYILPSLHPSVVVLTNNHSSPSSPSGTFLRNSTSRVTVKLKSLDSINHATVFYNRAGGELPGFSER